MEGDYRVAIELAWAAGFFDGEGHVSFASGNNQLSLDVSQIHTQVLTRFNVATGNIGRIQGPAPRKPPRQPVYRYRVSGLVAIKVLDILWPYLGPVKRIQADKAIRAYESRLTKRTKRDLPERRASKCSNGHSLLDKTNVYVRKSGSRNCLVCRRARENSTYRAKRGIEN